MVFPDRTADRSAELVLVEGCWHVGKEVLGIQKRVSVEVEPAAVEIVRAGLDDRVQHRAGVPAVFRIDGVRHQIKFRYGVRAWNDERGVQWQVV